MQKLALLLFVVVCASTMSHSLATQVQIVTDLGNVFTAKSVPASGNYTTTGIGTVARIQTVQPQGDLVYGSGYVGTTTPIRPYVQIPRGTNFAVLIQKDDNSVSLSLPEFFNTYDYRDGRLVEEQAPANILSFTKTRVLDGRLLPMMTNDGVKIPAGSGDVVMKMNSLAGRQAILRGNIPAGDQIQYVLADRSVDLTQIPYDGTNGWMLSDNAASFTYSGYRATYGSKCGYVHPYTQYPWYRYWTCWQYQTGTVPTSATSSVPLDLTVPDKDGLVGQTRITWEKTCTQGGRSYTCTSTSSYPATINGYSTGNGFHVTAISYTYSNNNGVPKIAGANFVLYDKKPYWHILDFTSDFEEEYKFPSDGRQMYVIFSHHGSGLATASARPYEPGTSSFLKINGLPPDTPYKIFKGGMVGAAGLSPPDGGPLVFDPSQIGFQTKDETPGGTLLLYPDSLWYRGKITSLVMDVQNKNSFNYDGPYHIHIPFAFIQVPIPTEATIDKVSVDTANMPYLAGRHPAGAELLIPTLPSMKGVKFTANGVPVKITTADIIGGSGVTIFPKTSNHDSRFSLTSPVSASAGVDGEAVVVATHDGLLDGIISLAVSADSRYYSGSSTLTVYVKTYVNGDLVGTKTLFRSQPPSGYYSQTIQSYTVRDNPGQYGSYYITGTNPYPYSIDSYDVSGLAVSGTVSVQVRTGDLVEFEVYVEEHADSSLVTTSYDTQCAGYVTTDVNTGHQACTAFSTTPINHLSEASSTVDIDTGYLLTG